MIEQKKGKRVLAEGSPNSVLEIGGVYQIAMLGVDPGSVPISFQPRVRDLAKQGTLVSADSKISVPFHIVHDQSFSNENFHLLKNRLLILKGQLRSTKP